MVLVLLDITDLRRADQIRRDFVANVSHELRTPLTAIRGYVEALTDGGATRRRSRRFLEIITRHTERMERLVKDLLRLARLDAGQETLEVMACETRTLIENVITDVLPAADQRQQEFEVTIAPGAESVRVDPAKLHDALRNLVANAITYAPERTTIRIEAAAAARRRRDLPSPTRGRGFRTTICRASSSASTASTSRGRAIPAAPASAWPSSSTSSSCTAAASSPRTAPTTARGSR